MAKIRHIAYRAVDVDAMAKFFVDAMGMKIIQKRKNNAIDLSDGSVNITVLPLAAGTGGQAGIDHIGFSTDNDQEQFKFWKPPARKKPAQSISARLITKTSFRGPEGIIVDVGHWQGAAPVDK